MSLTPRQRDCLIALQGYYDAHGVMPSLDELKDALGLKSKKNARQLLLALEDRGFIRRLPRKQRAIEILKPSPVTETRARCWLWDGAERGPQVGDAVIIERRAS